MVNNKKIPVIINCDTGIDDDVALIMAIKSNKIDIKLITTDVGNINTKQAAQNCLNVLELINADEIPVCAGEGKCLEQERTRVVVHGTTGLGDYIFEKNNRQITKGNAIEKIYETLKNNGEKITIICLSPPTNLAKLFIQYPDSKKYIEKIVFMAGSIEETGRNEIPYPEYNVSCDPEAAEIVFKYGVPIEIVPMEMGHTAYLTWQDVFKTKITNFVGSVLEIIYREYKDFHVKNGIATHDGCAIAYITNPEIFKTEEVKATIKYYDKLGTGVFNMNFDKKPNATVCTEVNVDKFRKLYFECLKKCK